MLRLDHVGVVVDGVDAVAASFLALGFKREGNHLVEGEVVDKINGLDGVRAEPVMVRTPDGSGKPELVKDHAPADTEGVHPLPANRLGFRHIAFEVEGLDPIVDGLRDNGADTVGEVREIRDSGDVHRLCSVRGPEWLIVELGQRIASGERARRPYGPPTSVAGRDERDIADEDPQGTASDAASTRNRTRGTAFSRVQRRQRATLARRRASAVSAPEPMPAGTADRDHR
jgi:hypothetical protein